MEEVIDMQYMLRSLGFPVKVPTELCGDNLRMIISITNPDADVKNKHVAISYHKLWESVEAGIVNPIKVCKTVIRSDILKQYT